MRYGQGSGPQGNSMSSNLVVASCYNQKPFYIISSKVEEVTWVPVTKKVWSSSLKENVDFTFLRWSLSHDYNYEMNANDIADQLRLVYRIMRFQLFLRGYEVSMVNLYVMMKWCCEMKGVLVPWNHHDWNEAAIGYTHLDPVEYLPRRKATPKNDDSTAGSATAASKKSDLSTKKKPLIPRGPRLDSSALSPTRGNLKCHLDHDTRVHMPVPPLSVNSTCTLHR